MRRAITIGYKHGCETPVVLTGPEVPLAQHRDDMREAKQQPHHGEFQRVEVWTSDAGVIMRKRFTPPPTPEEADAAADAQAAEEQAKKDAAKKLADAVASKKSAAKAKSKAGPRKA